MRVPSNAVLTDEERAAIEALEVALQQLPENLRITADTDDGIQVWRVGTPGIHPLIADLDVVAEEVVL